MEGNRFPKSQRLCGRNATSLLFKKGRRIFAGELQLVYLAIEIEKAEDAQLSIMVSVSKRHFRRAHDRNRIKRLLREAWRISRQGFSEKISQFSNQRQTKALHIAFVYQSDQMQPWLCVKAAMERALDLLAGKLQST
jgi:ribonuclease P protein component